MVPSWNGRDLEFRGRSSVGLPDPKTTLSASHVIVRLRHDREIAKPRIFGHKLRDLERLAFLKNGFAGDIGLGRGGFERCDQVSRISVALCGFSSEDAGQPDGRSCNEVAGHLDVNFA